MVQLKRRPNLQLQRRTFVGAIGCMLGISLCMPLLVRGATANDETRMVGQIAARLATASGVRAEFMQTQSLAAMQKPLVSTGSLVFLRGRGMIWRIATPYQAIYRITADGISEIDAQGVRKPAANPNGMRGMSQISRMLNAMLGGDLSALYSQFDVMPSGSLLQWQLLLTPNQPQLAQAVKQLVLRGGEHLQNIHIVLENGDSIQIEFLHSRDIDALTPAERNQLGVP